LSQKPKSVSPGKTGLHPRNRHRGQYDFAQLCKACPELAAFVSLNKYNNESINFSNAEAVKTLNKALLKYFYGIQYWDIPPNYLCPPIPGRADYIHYAADLLSSCNKGVIPQGHSVKVLDIGIGANCVYPIIGNKEYGWNFVGSDIDEKAIKAARQIITSNDSISKAIECRLQTSPAQIFKGIIKKDEFFDLSICNPPFHASFAEAQAGTERKWKNLGIQKDKKNILNFGGQNTELWCEGGEEAFVGKMVEQSAGFSENCFWFSSLISKKDTLAAVNKLLRKVKAFDVKIINMSQGQKISRMVAWTFLNEAKQKDWRLKRNV
jgi:23S rRNA (adenine1618-N6)-methyltransferase